MLRIQPPARMQSPERFANTGQSGWSTLLARVSFSQGSKVSKTPGASVFSLRSWYSNHDLSLLENCLNLVRVSSPVNYPRWFGLLFLHSWWRGK